MYCKAQLSGDSQNKAKMSAPALQILPMAIQIDDQLVNRGTQQCRSLTRSTKRSGLC